MKYKTFAFISLLLLVTLGCQDGETLALLTGSWKAAGIYENGQAKNMDISNIHFQFNDDKSYTYQSNADYQEAGTFYVDGKLLYTTDTIHPENMVKSVRINQITADSLFLDMNQGGVQQLWKLYRE